MIYITGRSQKTEVRRQKSEDRSQKPEVRSGQSQSQSQKAKAKAEAEPARTTWSEGVGSRKPEVRSASAALCVTFVSSVVKENLNHRESQRTHDLSDRVVRADLSQYSVIAKEPQSVTRNLQPAGSVQEAGMFARRSEMAAQWSEMTAHWTEMPSQWSETTAQWTEIPAQRSEITAQWSEMPAQYTETSARWKEAESNIPVRCTFGAHRISLATNIAGALHLRSIPEGLYVYRKTASRGNSTPNGVAQSFVLWYFYKHGMPLASKSSQLVACSLQLAAFSFCTFGVNRIFLATNIIGALHLQPGTLNFKPATLNLLAACGLWLAAFSFYKHGMPLASGSPKLVACSLQLAAFLLLVTRSSKLEARGSKLAACSLQLEAKNISVTSYPSTANSGSVCNLSSNRCPAAAAITAISVLAAVGALWIYRHQFLTSPAARAQQKGGMWMRSE